MSECISFTFARLAGRDRVSLEIAKGVNSLNNEGHQNFYKRRLRVSVNTIGHFINKAFRREMSPYSSHSTRHGNPLAMAKPNTGKELL